jgi:hypothetical protein
MIYQDRLKKHLEQYKQEVLGISEQGVFAKNGKRYAHILPASIRDSNLLEGYRESIVCYLAQNKEITRHRDFHHLNSSQAMCFNLLIPIMQNQSGRAALQKALGFSEAISLERWQPELIEPSDGTYYDFYLETVSRSACFMELKLSESEFGTAAMDKRHLSKLSEIYAPKLMNRLRPEALEPEAFFGRYQLNRNLYGLRNAKDWLFLIFPKANRVLEGQALGFLETVLNPFRAQIKILYLEVLVNDIIKNIEMTEQVLIHHYESFKLKYCLEGSN